MTITMTTIWMLFGITWWYSCEDIIITTTFSCCHSSIFSSISRTFFILINISLRTIWILYSMSWWQFCDSITTTTAFSTYHSTTNISSLHLKSMLWPSVGQCRCATVCLSSSVCPPSTKLLPDCPFCLSSCPLSFSCSFYLSHVHFLSFSSLSSSPVLWGLVFGFSDESSVFMSRRPSFFIPPFITFTSGRQEQKQEILLQRGRTFNSTFLRFNSRSVINRVK